MAKSQQVLAQEIRLVKSTRNYHVYTYGDNFTLYVPRTALPSIPPPVLTLSLTMQ